MKKYDIETFSYGAEIEWGDVNRNVRIPKHIGSWENCETDIVNIKPPYQYVACDPLGIKPPMGGEINIKPTISIDKQLEKISELKELFEADGSGPTSACVLEGHVHIHVPGLKDDIDALHRLTQYVWDNQEYTIQTCLQFEDHPEMKSSKGAKMYLKLDAGRMMPEYIKDNILNRAKDFQGFVDMHCMGKDGVSRGRPFRYGINMYAMKHLETVEFRCFRSTTDLKIIRNQLEFIQKFMDSALNGGPSAKEIIEENGYEFPPFVWDKLEYDGWKATKYGKERGTKQRKFYEAE